MSSLDIEHQRIDRTTLRYVPTRSGRPVTWGEMIDRWRSGADLTEFLSALANAPFAAYFWETPAVAPSRIDDPFEFVLVDAPGFVGMRPEPGPFAEHIGDGHGRPEVRTFPNLGGDAVLVAPCAASSPAAYPHLAAFARQAPEEQIVSLWREVGAAVESALGPDPRWVSTAGGGVNWLHVRIDTRPKYYQHGPYRSF